MTRRRRRATRLKDFDYAQAGAYFVTICTYHRELLFGKVVGEVMQLNSYGRVVQDCWEDIPVHYKNVELDEFRVMPNHVHGVIVVLDDDVSRSVGARHASPLLVCEDIQAKKRVLGNVVGSFKSAVTKRINEVRKTVRRTVWQRNFHDHIVRNATSLERIREYIFTNPERWDLDKENPHREGVDRFDIWLQSFTKRPSQDNLSARETTTEQ